MRTSAPGSSKAPTLAAGAAALPPEGARSPWGGLAANRATRPAANRGFTLLELLVVVAIIAIASAGVSFALRETGSVQLEREAQRLAALLESARAQSRLSGLPVRWQPLPQGFRFDGLAQQTLPQNWLSEATQVQGNATLLLGPEPIIGPQAVVLMSPEAPGRSLRIATDGVRPFSVSAAEP